MSKREAKREAKRQACSITATLIQEAFDADSEFWIAPEERDEVEAALKELMRELERRGRR